METILGAVIATITGVAALNNRIHVRISELDRRLDFIEIKLAEKYTSKDDLNDMFRYLQESQIRLEAKIDRHLALSSVYEGPNDQITGNRRPIQ